MTLNYRCEMPNSSCEAQNSFIVTTCEYPTERRGRDISAPTAPPKSQSTPLGRTAGAGRQRAEARHLFNGMVPGSETATRQKTAAGDGEDRISALHEDILDHILSFLPSCEVVQTCVLARSWSNRWKSVPALRVTEDLAFETAHEMNKFVNYLVVLRGPKPLVECEIHFWHADETFSYLDLWVRYVILCKVRVLRVYNEIVDALFRFPSLVSNKLTTVELCRVESEEPLLDFSSCPALQELKLSYSTVEAANILSPSVEAEHMPLQFPWGCPG